MGHQHDAGNLKEDPRRWRKGSRPWGTTPGRWPSANVPHPALSSSYRQSQRGPALAAWRGLTHANSTLTEGTLLLVLLVPAIDADNRCTTSCLLRRLRESHFHYCNHPAAVSHMQACVPALRRDPSPDGSCLYSPSLLSTALCLRLATSWTM